jgi:hypothetical protein
MVVPTCLWEFVIFFFKKTEEVVCMTVVVRPPSACYPFFLLVFATMSAPAPALDAQPRFSREATSASLSRNKNGVDDVDEKVLPTDHSDDDGSMEKIIEKDEEVALEVRSSCPFTLLMACSMHSVRSYRQRMIPTFRFSHFAQFSLV